MHRIEQNDQDRIKVVYRMEITGSGADEGGRRMGPASPLTGPRPWTRRSRWLPPYALRL
ncbi:hypothetical protein [Pseudarthrobacter sp. NIBRBAC000502772]|uniref:hypothetical protein n=1 Tax=Pseudarthrobacter sp. NIBRBAC000502772 TaxID=2590775 RepID=UPI001FF0527B|nr:hypothetical protein [Pseudarthrobacter sp. NIBRBAC000502772]